MNWYIGQEIVCIDAKGAELTDKSAHSGLKAGGIYKISTISKSCHNITLGVGISSDVKNTRCNVCGNIYETGSQWMFRESRFAPLEYNQDAINELLENTLVKTI